MDTRKNSRALGRLVFTGLFALCLVSVITLFPIQPALAGGVFEEPCGKDLSKTLDSAVRDFDMYSEVFPERPNLVARRLGATHALCIDELVNLAEKFDMSRWPVARQGFVAELEWVRDLLQGDMSEIYLQGKHYETQNDEGTGHIIGIYLRQWAFEHNYPPAEFDFAQGYGVRDGELIERRLLDLAERGYMPAILDAARRFLRGDGVKKNRGEAWYWLKRAQQENVDTSSITQKSLNQLLEDMDERERWTLAYLSHVYDDLDLSNIKIPSAFMPLLPKIPDPLSDQEVGAFVEKYHGLSRKTDKKNYISIERELVVRTVGIRYVDNVPVEDHIQPFGMSHDEFAQRKCNYHRAIGKIFPQGRDKIGHQSGRQNVALSSLFDKDAARYVNGVIQSGYSCPNPESEELLKALVWAKRLDHMEPAALRELAAKHFEKSGSVGKDRFKPDASSNNQKNEFEPIMHFILARTIQKFASFKEQEK